MDMSKVFHGILWILALTTDSFVVSFAYGMEKIKLSFLMVVGMNLIMSCLLGMAVLTGNFLSCFYQRPSLPWFVQGFWQAWDFTGFLSAFFQNKRQMEKRRKGILQE